MENHPQESLENTLNTMATLNTLETLRTWRWGWIWPVASWRICNGFSAAEDGWNGSSNSAMRFPGDCNKELPTANEKLNKIGAKETLISWRKRLRWPKSMLEKGNVFFQIFRKANGNKSHYIEEGHSDWWVATGAAYQEPRRWWMVQLQVRIWIFGMQS